MTSTLQGHVPFVLINTSIIELQSKGFIEGSQMSTNAENAATNPVPCTSMSLGSTPGVTADTCKLKHYCHSLFKAFRYMIAFIYFTV